MLSILGQGGIGAVYKGRHKSLDRIVAIKILPPEAGEDDMQFAERFKNEARTMAKMNHPAIARSAASFSSRVAPATSSNSAFFVSGGGASRRMRAAGARADANSLGGSGSGTARGAGGAAQAAQSLRRPRT